MNGIILVNAYYETEATVYQAERMKAELEALSLSCRIVKNNGEFCKVDEGVVNSIDTDFCVCFDKDFYTIDALERNGVRVFNTLSSIKICDDKMLTHLELAGVVDMPRTMSGTFSYVSVVESVENIQKIEKQFTYPMVLKKNASSLGAGVYLVNNRDELVQKIKELSGKPYLIQEYIRSAKGEDYRLIVIGGKCVASMRRSSNTDFRSNIELGGKGECVTVPKEFVEIAESAAKKLKLDYCGVDILNDNGRPLVCEVNSNAFFGGIEKITGVNVAKAYAMHVKKSL